MNFRAILNSLQTTTGKALLGILGIVVLIFICLPFLEVKKDSVIKVEKPDDVDKKAIIIETKIPKVSADKAYKAPAEKPQVINIEPVSVGKKESKSSEKIPLAPSVKKPLEKTEPEKAKKAPVSHPEDGVSFLGRTTRKAQPIFLYESSLDAKGADQPFLSDRYAPFGRLLSCKLVNTLESNVPNTPVIAILTEPLYWQNSLGEKKLILPVGTELHGTVGGTARNRLTTGNSWNLIWQITSPDNMVGFEMTIQGYALEKSHQPGRKDLAAITDMSAGIPGQVIDNKNLDEMMMYVFAAIQGASQGFQTNEVSETNNSVIYSQQGSTQNAIAMAMESVAQVGLQQVADRIAKESYYIRVAAGTDFYLYVTQVIDIDQARVANTQLSARTAAQLNGSSDNSVQERVKSILDRYQSGAQAVENNKPSIRQIQRRNFR